MVGTLIDSVSVWLLSNEKWQYKTWGRITQTIRRDLFRLEIPVQSHFVQEIGVDAAISEIEKAFAVGIVNPNHLPMNHRLEMKDFLAILFPSHVWITRRLVFQIQEDWLRMSNDHIIMSGENIFVPVLKPEDPFEWTRSLQEILNLNDDSWHSIRYFGHG